MVRKKRRTKKRKKSTFKVDTVHGPNLSEASESDDHSSAAPSSSSSSSSEDEGEKVVSRVVEEERESRDVEMEEPTEVVPLMHTPVHDSGTLSSDSDSPVEKLKSPKFAVPEVPMRSKAAFQDDVNGKRLSVHNLGG